MTLVALFVLPFLPSLGTAATNANQNGEYLPRYHKGIATQDQISVLGREVLNDFNLNLMLSFSHPGTPSYPVSPGMTLQLARFYNSNVRVGAAKQCETFIGKYLVDTQRIRRTNPIGLGWELNPGKIVRVFRQSCG
jgi:hypothetical protein